MILVTPCRTIPGDLTGAKNSEVAQQDGLGVLRKSLGCRLRKVSLLRDHWAQSLAKTRCVREAFGRSQAKEFKGVMRWIGSLGLTPIHYGVLVVQLFSRVQLFVTPWTAARQASLFFTISQNLLKFMTIELVMPSNHLILSCPLLLLPSIFPSIGVFSSESALHIRWQKYWSFSFSISPSNAFQGWFPLGLTDLISLLSKGLPSILY